MIVLSMLQEHFLGFAYKEDLGQALLLKLYPRHECLFTFLQGGRMEGVKDRKIFIGGLPSNADEELIRNFFSKYGKVGSVCNHPR